MRANTPLHVAVGTALAVAAIVAQAHITLPPGGAAAGSDYAAAFRVGHACKGASATTGVTVRLPTGFRLLSVKHRPGWASRSTDQEVSWIALSPKDALPAMDKTTFDLSGRLPDQAGTLWFKVLQVCDQGQADWATVPTPDEPKPAFPAARLEVSAPTGAP